MNKPVLSISLLLSIFLLTQSNAFANNRFENRFEHRQQKQSHRIENGFINSDFTYQEFKRLIITQHKLQRLSDEFMEDGRYGHKERKILRKKLNRLDDMIYRMRHNQKKYSHKKQYDNSRQKGKDVWRYKRHAHSS